MVLGGEALRACFLGMSWNTLKAQVSLEWLSFLSSSFTVASWRQSSINQVQVLMHTASNWTVVSQLPGECLTSYKGCPVGVNLLQQPGQLRRKVRLVCHTVLSNFTLCYCFVWSGMLTCSSKMWSSLPHCAFPDPELVSALVSGVSALLQFRSCPRTPFSGP